MERKELIELTNEDGEKFVNNYLKNVFIISTEEDHTNSDFFFVLIRYEQGSVSCLSFPKKGTTRKACTFGDFDYFAIMQACDIAGIKTKFNFHTSYPIWPWWYCSKDEYDVFFKEYKRLHAKYKQHLFT